MNSNLQGTNNRAFEPWIGDRYATEGLDGIKLLILGESQYSRDLTRSKCGKWDIDKEATRDIVRWHVFEHGRGAFFRKIAKLLLHDSTGRPHSCDELADCWNRVAFYNFIQWWLPGARSRPTSQMWLDAHAPLLQTIEECQPQCLLVLGKKVREQLPSLPQSLTRIDIPHPSSWGFSYSPWAAVIRAGMLQFRGVNEGPPSPGLSFPMR